MSNTNTNTQMQKYNHKYKYTNTKKNKYKYNIAGDRLLSHKERERGERRHVNGVKPSSELHGKGEVRHELNTDVL